MTTKNWRIWQPPSEAIDTIATVLSEHWTAARSRHVELFWPGTMNWRHELAKLRQPTSAPEAEDSSDTLPDPHPC